MEVETLWRRSRADFEDVPVAQTPNGISLKRRLETIRLMYIAAVTGARFVGERFNQEPIEWLLKEQCLFDGHSAMEACAQPEGFRRVVLLHGLALGLDAEPKQVAGIPAGEFISPAAQRCLAGIPPGRLPELDPWKHEPASLYTSFISADLHGENVQIFCAMIARSPSEVRARLRRRFGVLVEDNAKVRLGFDGSEPLACALVSDAMAHLLSLAADSPTSELARGLDFVVEQRFSA